MSPGGNAAVLDVDVAGNKPSFVTVNPNTGLPLGQFVYEDTYVSFITAFHSHFAAVGRWLPWGLTTLACLGVAMIVSMATGLYLWWPRNRNWYAAFTLKRGTQGRRRLLDLHNLFAVYLYVPLLVVALTGVDLTRPDWIVSQRFRWCRRPAFWTPRGSPKHPRPDLAERRRRRVRR